MRGEIQLVSGERRDKGRSEAEYRAEREPDEYWVNVYRDRRSKQLVTETNFTSLADAYENMLAGYTDCQYLHTIHVSKSATRRAPPDASAFNLEDDARAWLVERMGS